MDDASTDLNSFVNQLLVTPPGPPNSIRWNITTDDGDVGLFEALLTVMTTMMRTWYAPPIDLGRVIERDVVRLKQYFASFGVQFMLDIAEEPRVLRINNREYEYKTNLRDMKFQLVSGGKLFTVRFGL